MQVTIHDKKGIRIAEILSEELMITSAQDALDLMGDIYDHDVDRLIIHEKNIAPDFFTLKNGVAGDILQKFSNYRTRLAIIGKFDSYPGQSLKDFIYESNKGKQVAFVSGLNEAIDKLTN